MTSSGGPCSTRSTSTSRAAASSTRAATAAASCACSPTSCGIAEGFGYDPAAGAIEDARRLAGDRPLHFEAASTVPDAWSGLDVAFSHEMLYLLSDLTAARSRHPPAPCAPAACTSRSWVCTPAARRWSSGTPPNHEELGCHRSTTSTTSSPPSRRAGFDASASRLAIRFVPTKGHGHQHEGRLLDALAYYYDQKLMLRFAR